MILLLKSEPWFYLVSRRQRKPTAAGDPVKVAAVLYEPGAPSQFKPNNSTMAKRELSSTLKNLKFMQRASQREEKVKKQEVEEVVVKSDDGFGSVVATQIRKCVVVMEGDPHPGSINGRMSFRGFNPLIDKLNNPAEPAAPASSSGIPSGTVLNREKSENGSAMDEAECSNIDNSNGEPNGDYKRKQSEVVSETQYPNKSPKTDQGQSSSVKSKGSFKKPKVLDYNILRASKNQTRKGRP